MFFSITEIYLIDFANEEPFVWGRGRKDCFYFYWVIRTSLRCIWSMIGCSSNMSKDLVSDWLCFLKPGSVRFGLERNLSDLKRLVWTIRSWFETFGTKWAPRSSEAGTFVHFSWEGAVFCWTCVSFDVPSSSSVWTQQKNFGFSVYLRSSAETPEMRRHV